MWFGGEVRAVKKTLFLRLICALAGEFGNVVEGPMSKTLTR